MIDHCVLTGAGSGIGRAIALKLAEQGIFVMLVGRPDSISKTCALIRSRGGQAETFAFDLADHAAHQTSLTAAIATKPAGRWGAVLAASMLDPRGSASTASEYEQVFRVNVAGNLAVLEACLPVMRAQRFGRALFFAGGGAAYAYPAFPGYALSKVSTVRLVENLAASHKPGNGFSFVCLAPGAVDTPMLEKVVAAGGTVKTKTAIDEPVRFAERYFASTSNALSGRYVHVRDRWQEVLDGTLTLQDDQFLLRRFP